MVHLILVLRMNGGGEMDSIEKLIDYYNKSSEEDMYHNVVKYMLKHLEDLENATIYDMAEFCYSSPSTISRLVKRLDFKSYPDFKEKILYALKNYRYLNRNTREMSIDQNKDVVELYFNFLMNNMTALKENLDYEKIARISDSFWQAENVIFYSYPDVQIEALQKAMIVSGKQSIVYHNIAAGEGSLEKVKEKDVVFAVVPDLIEMAPMRSILKKAKNCGAVVITLCSEEKNDYQKYSDIQISFQGTKTSMDLYLFMILTNIIKYDYCHRYLDELVEEVYG